MKYEKPRIVHSVDAVCAIQHSDPPTKGEAGADLVNKEEMTIPAYEADE